MKNNNFKHVPIMCLVFFEAILHEKRSEKRLIFGRCLKSFKNDPKSIGVCLGTLISHFGIIKPHKILKIP